MVCGAPEDPEAAQAALDMATTILQSLTGQQLLPVEGDRVLLDSDGASTLLLPEVPVTGVEALSVEGVPLTPDEYEWSTDGLLRLTGVCAVFPDRYQAVDITYDHGYDPVPGDLALLCAGLACRISHGGPGGIGPGSTGQITAEWVGSYRVQYAQPSATGLSAGESSVIARYRV